MPKEQPIKIILLLFVSYLATFATAKGNTYNCTSPSSKPVITKESIKTELSLTTMIPFITSNEINRENLEFKKPFLIYYAIDSSEAFMQYSIRFEIAKLQQSCRINNNVQFVAFLNSLYVEKNSFIICKNQKISTLNFKNYPLLHQKLRLKRRYISSDDNNLFAERILKFKVTHKSFEDYPLAHPDFLHELIHFTISDKRLFPNESYAAFLNLKSHGTKEYLLAGLHDCQKKAKVLSSQKIIRNILSKTELKLIDNLDSPDKVEKNITEYENIISKLDLGTSRGVGSFNTDPKLGEDRLGEDRLSINERSSGNAFAGLGAYEGLGAEYAFGTNQVHLSAIFDELYKEGSNMSLGFLMLEACDTNRNPSLFHSNLTNIFGYYTAKKSLWYRNLNWWEILEDAKGLTVNMVNILQEETAKIPNIEIVEK